MTTIKLKDAIKIISQGGYIKEPSNYFSSHTIILDKDCNHVGSITYNCYFEIKDCLSGLWKHGHQLNGNDYLDKVYRYSTVKGDFKQLNQKLI
jgi:hypothetical protein